MSDEKEEVVVVTNDKVLKEMGHNVHETDRAVVEAAASGEGLIPVTPELLKKLSENIAAREADIKDRYPKLVEACPYEMKLAVTAWVMKHIYEHAHDGGSYRYLIYERLGFNTDAYFPLCEHGLQISNEYDMEDEKDKSTV